MLNKGTTNLTFGDKKTTMDSDHLSLEISQSWRHVTAKQYLLKPFLTLQLTAHSNPMKTSKSVHFSMLLASTLLFNVAAKAEGLSFLPFMQEGFKYEPTLSFVGGQLDPDVDDVDESAVVGIELSFNYPLLATPSNGIREQLSITSFDNDGLEMTSFEINPHYVINLSPSFGVSFGPGIGLVNVDYNGDSDTAFTGQLGASLQYRTGTLYFGLEARQQYTANINMLDDDVNNSRISLKIGHDF